MLGLVLGLLSIVTAVIALRTGRRGAVRITAACVIINAVTALPAFFVDIDAAIKVAVSVVVGAPIATVMLLVGPRSAHVD